MSVDPGRREWAAKTAPARVAHAIPRPGLCTRIARSQVVWVSAPAGSGKSTLLAMYAQRHEGPVLWYRIDEADLDVVRTVGVLASALESLLDVSPGTLPRMPRNAALDPRDLAHQFVEDTLALVDRPILFVFDDAHRAVAGDATIRFLAGLCSRSRAPLRIVLASRQRPPPSMARIFVHGQADELRTRDLALSAEEVGAMASMLGFVDLPAARAAHIARTTHGWAAGVRLMISGGHADSVDADTAAINHADDALSDYFAEEVCEQLPQATRQTLEQAALLPVLPAQLAVAVTGDSDAVRVLDELAQQQLFVSRVGDREDRTYEIHALFRGYLHACLRERLPDREMRALRHRAALACERAGLLGEAVAMHAACEDSDSLMRIILREAPRLAETGQLVTLETWLDHLDPVSVDSDPALLLWRATCSVAKEPDVAARDFARAYNGLKAAQDWPRAALAWAGTVEAVYFVFADLTQLDAWLLEYENVLAPTLEDDGSWSARRAFVWLFVAYSCRCPGHDRLRVLLPLARQRLSHEPDAESAAMLGIYIVTLAQSIGDLGAAIVALQEVDLICARAHSPLVRVEHSLIRVTLALSLGDHATAESALGEGLAAVGSTGLRVWEPFFLGNAAHLALARNDIDAAKQWLQRMRESLGPDVGFELARYHHVAAWLAAERSDPTSAHAHLREAAHYQIDAATYFGGLYAVCEVATRIRLRDEPARVDAAFTNLDLCASRIGSPMLAWISGLLRGHWLIERGDEVHGQDALSKALAIGRRHDYLHFAFFPHSIMSRAAYTALERGLETDYVRRLVRSSALLHPVDKPRLDDWPWYVRVFTLGRFAIVRNGERIEFKRKAQRVPSRLLQAIIAFGGRQVPESRVVDALWPESEGDAGINALTTAIHRLRQLIGEDAVTRQDGKLTLNAALVGVDAWELEQLMAAARQEPASAASVGSFVEKVRRLYQRPFLDSEPDAIWAADYRERLHAASIRALTARLAVAIEQGDWAGAAALGTLGLHVDDCVETFHQALIRAHLARHDPSAAVLAYQCCQRVLAAKLRMSPCAETVTLYAAARGAVASPESA